MTNGFDQKTELELLLDSARKGDPAAWDELYRLFGPFIHQRIIKSLHRIGQGAVARNEESVLEIFDAIVRKLFVKKEFLRARDISRIQAWLYTVIRNHVIDWVRIRFSRSRADETFHRLGMVSLDAPLSTIEDNSLTLIDTLCTRPPPRQLSGQGDEPLAEPALCMVETLGMEARWAMRLNLMHYCPLEEEEIRDLCEAFGLSPEFAGEKIRSMEAELAKKAENARKDADRSRRLERTVRALEKKLLENIHSECLSEEEVRVMRETILDKAQGMNEAAGKSKRLIEPARKQIAELMGIPEPEANRVNVLIWRARRALWEKMKKNS